MASCSQKNRGWMYLVNHVFLPPKLPQADDTRGTFEKHLVKQALEALVTFKTAYDDDSDGNFHAIDAAIYGVSNLLRVHHFATADGGATVRMDNLETVLTKEVSGNGPTRPIPIKVTAQNAGLLIYRHEDTLRVETFELSPQTYAVTGTQGRLRRQFPGIAISIPLTKVEPAFIKTLARTLESMSGQVAPDTLPSSKKAGQEHEETRDTASPKMVTELLTAFMLPLGQAIKVSSIEKHTRDEVLWKSCLIPWRRSSLWLLVRVSIQLIFFRSGLEPQEARRLYKNLMVHFAAHLLAKITPVLKVDTSCKEWCDIVYIMRAKISRRLLKLEKPLPQSVKSKVREAMADNVLQRTWNDVQASEAKETQIDTAALQTLEFEKDTFASLPSLDDFISSISLRHGVKMAGTFTPRCPLPEINTLEEWAASDTQYSAFQTAWWDTVMPSLDQRLGRKLHDQQNAEADCLTLWSAMQRYREGIENTVPDNPEAWSLMILVDMELWAALDKIACKECPILRDYDPDVSIERLQCLLLPSRSHMDRLYTVEEYIKTRKDGGTKKDIWTSFAQPDTFAVRYFDQSPDHQSLRHLLEENAKNERQVKSEEYDRLKTYYAHYMKEYATKECQYISTNINGKPYEYHCNSCYKCECRKSAQELHVSIHEWPLPTDELALKTVVFELQVPKWFTTWRQATSFVRFNLLGYSYSRTFHFLGPVFQQRRTDRAASQEKSHVQTHYKPKLISGLRGVESIFFENGRRYRYYDSTNGCFVGALSVKEGRDELAKSTAYRLPSTSSSIQKFIHRPPSGCDDPSANTVLATQSECPSHLTLTEYKALCSIPLGHMIQWQNILLQVTAPAVDFKKAETVMVVLQAMYQAGPRLGDDWHRDGHHIPATSERFAKKMLAGLRGATDRIEGNWKCVDELACYIAIARRILSLGDSDDLKRDVLAYLAKAREVGLHWLKLLKSRVDNAVDEEKQHFRSRVAHTALVCVDSFNSEDTLSTGESVLGLALQSSTDVADFIECCITIQECYAPGRKNALGSILYWRWQQLCVRANDTLYKAIVYQGSDALDKAIQQTWVAFNPLGEGWNTALTPGCCHNTTWLIEKSGSPGGEDLTVHYCLVTGELRVNGLPLSRLPEEYETHPMYSTLFGNSVMEVMPCNVPGMVFSSRKPYAGHEVFFGLSEGDLNIRAVKDGRIWEFVNPACLQGFPRRLVDGCVHWYEVASNTVKFRSKKYLWTSSDVNWVLVLENGKWRLTKGSARDQILVSPVAVNRQSQTALRIGAIFSRLVHQADLELIYRPSSLLLEVKLPTLKLAFHLDRGSGTIHSRQFRGMTVDPEQAIETLIGLENKLTLKDTSDNRIAIILEGSVSRQLTHSHIQVNITRDTEATAHAYRVDTRLGRLIDNGSLESKLHLCYLHALTSFCLPDPLTKRTGTEQALDILDSAAVKSFPELSRQNIKTLTRISDLTPGRVYYPVHLKVMQTVSWAANLTLMSQHNRFFRAVTSLFEAAAGRAFFYRGQSVEMPTLGNMEPDLVRRDEIRSACFMVSQYGAEDHRTDLDTVYNSRDRGQGSPKARDAFRMADYIANNRTRLPHPMPGKMTEYIWKYLEMEAADRVVGGESSLSVDGSEAMPGYEAHWLLDSHNELLARKLVLYHKALSRGRENIGKFDTVIWLSTMAFSRDANLPIIQMIASFINQRLLSHITPPGATEFSPRQGYTFDKVSLALELQHDGVYRGFYHSPEYKDSKNKGYEAMLESNRRYYDRRHDAINVFIDCAKAQWPCAKPEMASHERRWEWETYVETSEATKILHRCTTVWFDNLELHKYLGRIVKSFPPSAKMETNALCEVRCSATQASPTIDHRPGFISDRDIFLCPPPELEPFLTTKLELTVSQSELTLNPSKSPPQSNSLDALINQLSSLASVAFEKDYVTKLQESVDSLDTRNPVIPSLRDATGILEIFMAVRRNRAEEMYSGICAKLNEHMLSQFMLDSTSGFVANDSLLTHLPRLSPSFLLQRISRRHLKSFPSAWKQCITKYAVALADSRRAERMLSAAQLNDLAALSTELQNPGHENWDPLEYPDSLLLEVESGITIRNVQEEIAARMRAPPRAKNSVMQLNMGEGKSSVIVPIVASALADGSRVVRVLVAKPQSKQMLQMLTSKLGGLLDRVVFQMPFSRDLQVTYPEALSIRQMLETCRDVGGVLLVQPEHVLSLQQMGTEYAMTEGKSAAGETLNLIRHFLFNNARDIVDESDENFSVKFELVYTMGLQQAVDHSPQRWRAIQEVLGLVRSVALEVQREFPDAIEIHDPLCPGGFPRTRVLKHEAMRSLLDKLVSRICEEGIAGLPIHRQSAAVRDVVRTYISKNELSEDEMRSVEGPTGFWSDSVRPTLLLLRGLIAGSVLTFAFTQKRWRVNYGLAPGRKPATRLAVPYQAKDQPSARSEFSHPDVVIILACLSYYYSGLTDEDLFLSFDQLLRSDQAEIEYALWVTDQMPKKFQTLAGVNTEDKYQCVRDVFPHLRFSKAVVDYFLDNVVYPKEMKEFPSKLSTSGWDLGEKKVHPTTGFSGTNDSRRLLPLGMRQLDLEDQKHTNALVISYLLQPETSVTDIPPRAATQPSDADALLDLVISLDPPVRVILDVGAQVLELRNVEVARQWLEKANSDRTLAVVFFDDNDELSVIDRTGYTERLQTSPFVSQMEACLVFLDEAHTRGTDLKLPTNYRAAVTLGANQTKDGLMQGCMRMRKLGQGQSVIFCVPQEIKTKIKELRWEGDCHGEIQVSDILVWSIRETWTSLQRGVQLWASQGRRYEKHERLWTKFTDGTETLSADEAKEFLEDEAQTILQRYRPKPKDTTQQDSLPTLKSESGFADPILERLRDFGLDRCDAAALHEEQERELAPEIETEREQELPPPTMPAAHSLHPDISLFATKGVISPGSKAYTCAFLSLRNTRAARKFEISNIPQEFVPNLLVSADFECTVKPPGVGKSLQDLYLRSVQWVLVSRGGADDGEAVMLVVSPFEANSLIPVISQSSRTTLHIYSPRVNLAFPSLDDLRLFAYPGDLDAPIPRSLTIGLDLFAGQLYFNDHATYTVACKLLGLSSSKATDDERLDSDGFILQDAEGRVGGGSGFTLSPVTFLKDLMLIRRDSRSIRGTHVGDMLDNRPLPGDRFD